MSLHCAPLCWLRIKATFLLPAHSIFVFFCLPSVGREGQDFGQQHDGTCLNTCTGTLGLPDGRDLREGQVSDKRQWEDKDSGSFVYKIWLKYAQCTTLHLQGRFWAVWIQLQSNFYGLGVSPPRRATPSVWESICQFQKSSTLKSYKKTESGWRGKVKFLQHLLLLLPL